MSRDMVFEEVPQIRRRIGDMVVAGANNSTILLGRDRVGAIDSGYGARGSSSGGAKAGAIHLMAGRVGEDPSISEDAATVYLSAKTDPDANAATDSFGEVRKEKSAVIMRADCVRIVPRMDFKLSVGSAYLLMDSSGKVTIEGDVSLGEGAAERIIRGEKWSQFWNTVTVPTPMGPSGPPPPIPESVFSPRNKVK